MSLNDLVLVVFLEKTEGIEVGNESFPSYYEYRYNSDPKLLLEEAVERGFLIKSDYKFNIYQKTNAELKEILRDNDLKVSGIKDELVERLIKNIDEEKLKSIFNQSYYKLSDSGKELVAKNAHIIYYHKKLSNVDIGLYEYHKALKKDNLNKYEAAIKLIKNKAIVHRKKGNWGLFRNSLSNIGSVYSDNGDSKNALDMHLKVCRLDLSGLGNNKIFDPSSIFLAPGIIGIVEKEMEILNYNENDLKSYYYNSTEELNLPKEIYSKEESFNYIIRGINKGADLITDELRNKHKDISYEIIGEKQFDKKERNTISNLNNKKSSGCFNVLLFGLIIFTIILFVF